MDKLIEKYFDIERKNQLEKLKQDIKDEIQEIRLRAQKPISVILKGKTYFISENNNLCQYNENLKVITKEEIENILNRMCKFSVHSYIENIRDGYITLDGGHRVGIGGNLIKKGQTGFNLSDVTSLNIRIAKEKPNCSNKICEKILNTNMENTLIVGAPSSGKTTILRDMARQISYGKIGNCQKVAVIDCRNEISGFDGDDFTFNLGPCTDVLVECDKAEGVLQAVRVLSPDVIICDEIGGDKDAHALISTLHSGVKIIASVHASSKYEIENKTQIQILLKSDAFSNIVLLKGSEQPGEISDYGRINNGEINWRNNDFVCCGTLLC